MSLGTVLVGLWLLAAPPVQDEEILYFDGEAAASVFDEEDYAFCRPEHRPSYVTLRTCALAGLKDHEDCPGLATACDELNPPEEEAEGPGWSLGPWAGPLRWMVLLVLAVLVADQLRRLRRPSRSSSTDRPQAVQTRPQAALPSGSARQIILAAEGALVAGDPPRALALLQQGLQRHIQDEKILAFDAALTHRDYLRSLKRQPELAALYRPFASMANRMRFGDGAVDKAKLAELLKRCRQLLLACLLLCTAACSEGPRPPSFESHEPNGLSALVAMLRNWGYEVKLFLGEVDEDFDYDLLIARTVPFIDYADQGGALSYSVQERALEGWPMVVLDDAETLVPVVDGAARQSTPVAPSTRYALTQTSSCGIDPRFFLEQEEVELEVPFMEELAWPEASALHIEDTTIELGVFPIASRLNGDARRSIANLYTFYFEDADYVLDTCVVHFPSSALASNESLTRPENRAFVLSIIAGLTPSRGRIAVVDALGLLGSADPSQAQFQSSPALPVLVQLGLCLLLWYWARGMSFGVLRDPEEGERRPFIEHAEALGGHYASCGPAGATHVVETLAQALGPRSMDEDRVAAVAAELKVSPKLLAQALAATRKESFEADPLEVAELLSRLHHEGR